MAARGLARPASAAASCSRYLRGVAADHPSESVTVRHALARDAAQIAAIFNEGVEDRVATFQTEPGHEQDFVARIASSQGGGLLVAEGSGMLGWGGILATSTRAFYAGVGEYQIYVARAARGAGIGAMLLRALMAEAERLGYWKLVGRLFATNAASIALARRCGFREVGTHLRHARLEGEGRDVLLVERSLGDASR